MSYGRTQNKRDGGKKSCERRRKAKAVKSNKQSIRKSLTGKQVNILKTWWWMALSAMVIFGPLVIASLLRFGCTSMKLHFRPISLFEKTINPDVIEGKLTLQKRRAKENCAGIHDNFVFPFYLLWCSKLLVTREPWLSIDRSIGFAWSQTLIYLFSKRNKIYIDEGKNKSINIMQSKEISQVNFNLKTATSN